MSFPEFSEEIAREAVGRSELLSAVDGEPRSLQELENSLSMSRSTIHRTTNSLIEKGLLQKSDGTFELTGVGRIVVDAIDRLEETVTGACHLEAFLNTIQSNDVDVPVEHFVDATVTRPRRRQAHFAVNRIVELIEQADSLRMFSSIISPFYVEVAHREMLEGMEITVVFDERVIETVVSEFQEEASEALETGRFEVHVTDAVPFELFIFDDRVGMAAHDENALARAFVETDNEAAIRWANDLYDRYESRATHADLG